MPLSIKDRGVVLETLVSVSLWASASLCIKWEEVGGGGRLHFSSHLCLFSQRP